MTDCSPEKAHHKRTFSKDVKNLSGILRWISEIAQKNAFQGKDLRDVEIASEEAISNIFLYSQSDLLEVNLTIFSEKIEIVLIDKGMPFNPLDQKLRDEKLPLEEMPLGGFGIFLMKSLLDELSYKRIDGQNRLTLVKKKKP